MENKHIENYYKNKTAENKQKAVLSMTNFIYKIINKYSNHNNRDDLTQQGYIGVLAALETWDRKKGAFTTHCYFQVFDYAMRYLKEWGYNTDNSLDNVEEPVYDGNKWFDVFIDLDRGVSKFNKTYIDQFTLSLQGYTDEEIAPLFGLGKTGVNYNVKRIKNHLLELENA